MVTWGTRFSNERSGCSKFFRFWLAEPPFVQYSLNMQIHFNDEQGVGLDPVTVLPVAETDEIIAVTFRDGSLTVEEYQVTGLWRAAMRTGWQILMGVDEQFWQGPIDAVNLERVEGGDGTYFMTLRVRYFLHESDIYPDSISFDEGDYVGVLSRVTLSSSTMNIYIAACTEVSVVSGLSELESIHAG